MAGLILLAVGAVLLLNTLGVNLPYWLISWQVGLIVIGLALGFRQQVQGLHLADRYRCGRFLPHQ